MTALTTPRGPLPARVYWTRRVVLLAVVLLLVVGIARLLGDGSDATSDTPTATRAAATTKASAVPSSAGTDPAAATSGAPATDPAADPVATGATGAATAGGAGQAQAPQEPATPVLPTPTSVCANEDVTVTPSASGAQAGGRVQFLLTLRSKATPACTWQVSADTVTLKITSGPDDIWASQQCRRSIPTQDVVLYQATDTTVPVVWSGRRSDEECSRLTEWAMPGWYHIAAATYAGEPTSVQFELGVPAPVTVTRTVQPEESSPSGAVEPDGD